MQQIASSSSLPPGNATLQPFEPRRVLARLVISVGAAVLLTAGATAGLIAATAHDQWWGAWIASLAVSLAAAVLSMGPIVPGLFAGAQYAAYGYLAGAGLRLMMVLIGGFAAIIVAHTPPAPTMLLTVPLYFAQLAAESVVLSRAFWPGKAVN